MTILVTLHSRGQRPRQWVGVYPGTSAAVVATLELLEREGATEAGRISAQVLP